MEFGLAGLMIGLPIASAALPDLQVGDLASSNLVTPIHLLVPDPERTQLLHHNEVRKTPVIFRFHSTAASEVETNFHSTLNDQRSQFLLGLKYLFHREQLDPSVLQGKRYANYVVLFQQQHQDTPTSSHFMERWALEQSDEMLRSEWSILLRAFMSHYISSDELPATNAPGPGYVWLLPAAAKADNADWAAWQGLASRVDATNLITLSKLRQIVRREFPPEGQADADFLAAFLQPNCIRDKVLIRKFQQSRTMAIVAATEYFPGQVILAAGQRVDVRTKAALDELRERMKDASQGSTWTDWMENARRELTNGSALNQWLMPILIVIFLVALVAATRLVKRRRHQVRSPQLLIESTGSGQLLCPNCATPVVAPALTASDSWQARALTAERRADQATAMMRAGLLPLLARWLKTRLVQGMLAQRNHSLATQQQAAADLAKLEERLAKVQAPLTERLRAYEQRIALLEQQLARKEAEEHELFKVKID